MLGSIILLVLAVGVGFALGRIKNASKLEALSTYLESAEAAAIADVKTLIPLSKQRSCKQLQGGESNGNNPSSNYSNS